MKHKVLEAAWLQYAEKVIPPNASLIQIVESRKAFYAGAGSLLNGILRVLGPGAEPTESDLLIMDGIKEELDQFLKDAHKL